jgi:lysophospholipase L1-like esterase
MGNIPEPEFTTRVTTLVETIRRARPHTPILFVGQSEIHPGKAPPAMEQLQDKIVRALDAGGVPGLSLFAGRTLMGTDGDGTVDGVHPNDLGMRRQADALAPVLTKLLRQNAAQSRRAAGASQ